MGKFPSANNTYHLLYNCLTGDTLQLATVNNTYEVLKAVYDDTNEALQVKFVAPITITESVTILADLTVSGTTTYINVVDLNVADNIICLNSGETGAGVTLGTAGLEVDRGTQTWAELLWDESVSGWTAGLNGSREVIAFEHTDLAGYGITDAYTKTECDDNFLSATTTVTDIGGYATSSLYTKTECDDNFLSANTALFDGSYTSLTDVPDFDSMYLSANTALFDGAYGSLTGVPDFDSMYLSASTVIPTDFYTQSEADANFLSATTSLVTSLDDLSDVNLGTPSANYVLTYDGVEWIASAATYVMPDSYTKTETDANFLSANTALFDGAYGSLTGVPDFDTMYLSASTTAADIGGITAQYVADNFLSANTSLFDGAYGSLTGVPDFDSMYLSANTAIPSDFYTTGEADANFLSANTSYYTQAQANNNFLSATTSYYTQAQANANFLSANTYEEKSFQIEFATQTPYYLTSYAPYAYDVITLYTFTNSGSCNISLSGGSDGATAIGSLTNVTTDTSLDTTNATSANTISAGHMLKLVVNSTTNASTLYGTIKIQRK
jgi:hypothetical protein